jgi:hypothetical protein
VVGHGTALGLAETPAHGRDGCGAPHRERREAQAREEAVGVARPGVDRHDELLDPRCSAYAAAAPTSAGRRRALVAVADDGMAHVDGRDVDERVGRRDDEQRHPERLVALVDHDDEWREGSPAPRRSAARGRPARWRASRRGCGRPPASAR